MLPLPHFPNSLQFILLPWLTIATKHSAETLVSALPLVFEMTTVDEERTRTMSGVSRWVNEKDAVHLFVFVDGFRYKIWKYIHLLICSFFSDFLSPAYC